jgi:surfeit locus 1 family protein
VTIASDTTTLADGPRGYTAPRSRRAPIVAAILSAVGVMVLSGLGVWQLERRMWKLELIDRVERRVHAPAVALPERALWPRVNARDDAYRHVTAKGHFLNVAPAFTLAVTERGGGYWVLAPFSTDDGSVVLINRGFVPLDRSQWPNLAGPSGEVTVTGLLRMSEPNGAFLRHNNPAADRWYSRDIEGIAGSRGLHGVAPYFIDADTSATHPAALPIGGLTVVAFPNNHLTYALTWFALAAMLAAWSIRAEWQDRMAGPVVGAKSLDEVLISK